MRQLKSVFILVIFCITTFSALAEYREISTITRDDVLLNGINLSNPGAKPILLIHGFMENTSFWSEGAIRLYELGYDVYLFNMRGHGNEHMRSVALDSSLPKMGFDEIVSFDIPEMIKYVYENSGEQRVNLVGHSMGTMSSRLALSGVALEDGVMQESTKLGVELRKMVAGVIAIASPSQFNRTSDLLRGFFKIGPDNLLSLKRFILTKLFRQASPTNQSRGIFSLIQQAFSRSIDRVLRMGLTPALVSSVITTSNLSKQNNELARLVEKGISIPDQDLFDDANRWLQNDIYNSRDGGIDYTNYPIPDDLNYIFTSAGNDGLAHPLDIRDDFNSQKVRNNMALVHVDDFSHMDLVTGKKGANYISLLIDNILEDDFKLKNLDDLFESIPNLSIERKPLGVKSTNVNCHNILSSFRI